MTDETERLDFVAGQVHGLKAVVLALIATHPDPTRLAAELAGVKLVGEAKAGASQASEALVRGMNDVLAAATRAVSPSLGRSGLRNP